MLCLNIYVSIFLRARKVFGICNYGYYILIRILKVNEKDFVEYIL